MTPLAKSVCENQKPNQGLWLVTSLPTIKVPGKLSDSEGVNPTEFQSLLGLLPCYLPFDRGFG